MSPRRKQLPDTDLVRIAADVVAERGCEATRFADVAAASGLAAATLVQRFGTREAMLDAVAMAMQAEVEAAFDFSAPPLDRLGHVLLDLATRSHFVFLVRRPSPGYSLELRKQIAFCLAEAIDRGEVPHCEIAVVARRIQLGFYGRQTAALLERSSIVERDVDELIDEVLHDLM